jgi:hypothetical protein
MSCLTDIFILLDYMVDRPDHSPKVEIERTGKNPNSYDKCSNLELPFNKHPDKSSPIIVDLFLTTPYIIDPLMNVFKMEITNPMLLTPSIPRDMWVLSSMMPIAAPRLRPLFKDKQIVEGSDGCGLFVDNSDYEPDLSGLRLVSFLFQCVKVTATIFFRHKKAPKASIFSQNCYDFFHSVSRCQN